MGMPSHTIYLMNPGLATLYAAYRCRKERGLVAHKLYRPPLFPRDLPIPGYLPTPRSVDSLVDSRDFPLTGNAVTGRTLVVKKAQRIVSPRRSQHVLFFNVCVEDSSCRGRFIDELSVLGTACECERTHDEHCKFVPPRWFPRIDHRPPVWLDSRCRLLVTDLKLN